MKDFENIGREMPYRMPEHFMDDMTERVLAEIRKEQQVQPAVRRKVSPMRYICAAAAGVAAVVMLVAHPFSMNNNAFPDYESISQCDNIDEVFQKMSTDDLGLYSMMSNYYGD